MALLYINSPTKYGLSTGGGEGNFNGVEEAGCTGGVIGQMPFWHYLACLFANSIFVCHVSDLQQGGRRKMVNFSFVSDLQEEKKETNGKF